MHRDGGKTVTFWAWAPDNVLMKKEEDEAAGELVDVEVTCYRNG